MVYPVLEAATPPALVQTVPGSVLALEVPTQDSASISSKASAQPSSASLPVSAPLPVSAVTTAASLGHPLAVPPPLSPTVVHFTTTPMPRAVAVTPSCFEPFPGGSLTQMLAQILDPSQPKVAPEAPASQTKSSSFVEISADRQEYDAAQRILTAVGNVLLNYRTAILKADRVQTLALQRQVVAEGNITLTQGNQVLQGDRLEYRLDQARGILFKPRGIINIPTTKTGVATPNPGTAAVGGDPLSGIKGALPPSTKQPAPRLQERFQRLRFEADRIEFTAQTWKAINIRITSDPFSPPELEVRADQAQLQKISAKEDIVTLKRPRLVFDQGIGIPIPRSVVVLSRARVNPFTVDFGYDDRDRGGLFLDRPFVPISNRNFSLSLSPQFFVQRAILDRGFNLLSPDLYGLNVNIKSALSPKTSLGAYISLAGLDFTDFANNNLRAGLRIEQQLGENSLALESTYRERVVNGSLGEQTIQNRTGLIFNAPNQKIGATGIELNYRLATELLMANTDRFGGLNLITLGRLQGSASVQRAVDLWRGKALPPTATAGMKYTLEPIQPYIRIVGGFTGVVSGYSNGDSQTSLIGKLRLEGQFGHFSRSYLDYTGFFIGVSQGVQWGESPFLFDRSVDLQVISAGFLQQVYGPVRLGFQTSINLDTGTSFNTDIILDYTRRTYGLTLRYNPDLQVGSIVFRINSFNWVSNQDPLSGPGIGAVEAGVGQSNSPF